MLRAVSTSQRPRPAVEPRRAARRARDADHRDGRALRRDPRLRARERAVREPSGRSIGAAPLARPRPRLPRTECPELDGAGLAAAQTFPADGQMPASAHTSQRGLRASHTWRPCSISRSESSPPLLGRHHRAEIVLDLHRIVSSVSRSRCESRVTCVSTGSPGRRTRPSAPRCRSCGRRRAASRGRRAPTGISPPKRSSTACAIPIRFFAFDRKKPVERTSSSSSSGSAAARSAGVGYLREQRGRHHVHPLVGALRRQDRRDEQLVRVRVIERAVRVGIQLAQRSRRPPPRAPSHLGVGPRRHGTLVACADQSVARGTAGTTSRRSRRADRRARRGRARAADGHDALGDAVWRDLDAPGGRLGRLPRRATRRTRTSRASDNRPPRHWSSDSRSSSAVAGDGDPSPPGSLAAAVAHVAGHGGGRVVLLGPRRDRRRRRRRARRGRLPCRPRPLRDARAASPSRSIRHWPAGVQRPHRSSPAATRPPGWR